jgi:hypothetical protein
MGTKPKAIVAFTLASLLVLAASGCRETGSGAPDIAPPDPLVLKSYVVQQGYGDELHSIIQNIMNLAGGEERLGGVQLAPNGELLVAAPASFHEGLEEFLAKIKQEAPKAPSSVRVQYWIVIGRKSVKPESKDIPDHLLPVVEEIAKSQGPQEFMLLEHLSHTSLNNKRTHVDGAFVNIHSEATIYEGRVLLSLKIGISGSEFDTTLQVPQGKTLVLGQSSHFVHNPLLTAVILGKDSREVKLEDKSRMVNMYYIIRAERLD